MKNPIIVSSENFSNATDWWGSNADQVEILPQHTLRIFWNDVNKFLREGTDWNRINDAMLGSGAQIIIPGFNSAAFPYTFYVFISQ